MKYRIPRSLFKKLEENLGDSNNAEQFASSIEEAVEEIEKSTARDTTDKVSAVKMEIKDDLSKTLVTREMFQALHEHMDFNFHSIREDIDSRFENMQEQMDSRFENMQDQMDSRFQNMQDQMDGKFQNMQNQMDGKFEIVDEKFLKIETVMEQKFAVVEERFKRIDLKFNVLIGVLVLGFTLFNPGFLDLLKSILR